MIEEHLAEALGRSGHNISLQRCRRQYVGIISGGRKLIYLNAFPAAAFDSTEHIDWHKTAFTVCDGGDYFFGVIFDPADNTFHDFDFNGVA